MTSYIARIQNPNKQARRCIPLSHSVRVPSAHAHCVDLGHLQVIHRRDQSSGNFNRSWAEYRDGFGRSEASIGRAGSVSKNHWLGNENIHLLTSKGDQTLHITIHSSSVKVHATYDKFMIGDKQSFYRLHLGNFIGGSAGELCRGHTVLVNMVNFHPTYCQ